MPNIEILLLEGKSPEQKHALLEAVTRAAAESLDAALASFRVWITEIPRRDYLAGTTLEQSPTD
jgi:4-oxalocrotonate tautomerase